MWYQSYDDLSGNEYDEYDELKRAPFRQDGELFPFVFNSSIYDAKDFLEQIGYGKIKLR